MSRWNVSILCALLLLAVAVSAPAVEGLPDGFSVIRTISHDFTNGPSGMAVHPLTGDLYVLDSIGSGGSDILVVDPDGNVEVLAANIGTIVGGLADIVLGPDFRIYAGDTANGRIKAVDLDGNVTDYATISGVGTDAMGLAFDSAGNLYASDRGTTLWKIGPGGSPVTSFSTGWQDLDEIEVDTNDILYIADGSSGVDNHSVFRVDRNGNRTTFRSGLNLLYALAVDQATNDVYVCENGSGRVLRLHDADGSGTISDAEMTVFATDVSANVWECAIGRSSDGSGYSLYVGDSTAKEIVEIGGFGVPLDPDRDDIPAPYDNCPEIPNPEQSDRDLDGLGDPCDCAPQDTNEPGADGECPACGGIGTLSGRRIDPRWFLLSLPIWTITSATIRRRIARGG